MVLELRAVEKEYPGGLRALRGVDLVVAPGEYVLVQGASGAGKTTLLNLAGLLDEPTRGHVLFEGTDAARLPAARRAQARLHRIGFVFQHYYLAPDLTIRENVALPAMAAGLPAPAARARADHLLARVGLAQAASRLPRELSGGEQQRAGVARALVNQPALLLADEPTGNLDAANAALVADLLAEAHDEGVAVLLATHDPARFPQAERRLRIDGGRVAGADEGSEKELK